MSPPVLSKSSSFVLVDSPEEPSMDILRAPENDIGSFISKESSMAFTLFLSGVSGDSSLDMITVSTVGTESELEYKLEGVSIDARELEIRKVFQVAARHFAQMFPQDIEFEVNICAMRGGQTVFDLPLVYKAPSQLPESSVQYET